MILAETSPVIRAHPEKLFAFFLAMETNYLRWHPDHVCFRWLEKAELRTGAGFYFEERIGGKLLKKTVTFTRIIPGELIEFAPVSKIFALFLPRISFAVSRGAEGFSVMQEIVIRTGPIGASLNRREFNAVSEHMRQEGENLKRLLED